MADYSIQAFGDELEKLSFGPKAMKAVFEEFKRKGVKAADRLGSSGYGYQLNKGQHKAMLVGEPKFPKGQLVAPDKGDAYRQFAGYKQSPEFKEMLGAADPPLITKKVVKDTIKTPAERKALEAVVKGHELAESQIKPHQMDVGTYMFQGHASPDVLLREHNMVTTMPKDVDAVRKFMKDLRQGNEASQFSRATGGKFQYGEGERMSRHARKRILELMKNG